MVFLNPLMLAGLGVAVVPLVLHLVARARYERVTWGAMIFLDESDLPPLRSNLIREASVLFLRVLAIALLATALARPMLSGIPGKRAARSVVILIDRSGSMGTEEAGQSRINLARRVALQVVGALRNGDEAAVIPLGMTSEGVRFTTDTTRIVAGLSDISAGAARSDVAAGLLGARRMLDAATGRQKRIVIITDRQAASWEGINAEFAAAWNASSDAPEVVFLPVGGSTNENLAIESIDVVGPPPMAGGASIVDIHVRNYSAAARQALPLVLYLGQREAFRTTLTVPAAGSASIQVPVRFGVEATQTATAQIESGTVAFDDQLSTVIDVAAPMKVLIVSGGATPAEMDKATSSLRAALAPYAADATGRNPFSVQVVGMDRLIVPSRLDVPLIVLADCPSPSPEVARQLSQYVYTGGGLLVAPGAHSDYSSPVDGAYDEQDFLPFLPIASTGSEHSATTLLVHAEHPAAAFIDPESRTSVIHIQRRFDFGRLPDNVRVIAADGDGLPLGVETPVGWGRVAMTAIPLDESWSDLPSSEAFLPLVQSVARYLAAPGSGDRNLAIGDTATIRLPDAVGDTAVVVAPDETRATVDLLRAGPGSQVRYADTARPGRYDIRYSTDREPKSASFVVRWPIEESDPAAMDDAALETMAQRIGARRIDIDPGSPALATMLESALGGERVPREWTLPLLGAFVGVLLTEMMLVRLWTAGGR